MDNFQFVIVGDRTGRPRPGVFSNAMHQINLMQPEFVVHEKQLAFLKETIAEESDVRWTVLIVHHPLWHDKNQPEMPEELRPTYERWLEIENTTASPPPPSSTASLRLRGPQRP